MEQAQLPIHSRGVTTAIPIKRGLKVSYDAFSQSSSRTVTTAIPIKRGLKVYLAKANDDGSWMVTTAIPIKRGLKVVFLCLSLLAPLSYNCYPD